MSEHGKMMGFDSIMHVPNIQQQRGSLAKEVTFLTVLEYLNWFPSFWKLMYLKQEHRGTIFIDKVHNEIIQRTLLASNVTNRK